MLAICAALQWEVRPLLRSLQRVVRLRSEPSRVWRGSVPSTGAEVVVYRSGIGGQRAIETTTDVLDRFPVSAIINTGCAGALLPRLSVGTVVVADRVLLVSSREKVSYTSSMPWNSLLMDAGRTAGLDVAEGPVATSEIILSSPSDKHAVHARLGAVAVDMEAFAVARVACEREVEFACARVILDDVETELPPLEQISGVDDGLDPLRVAAHVLKQPGDIPRLVGLAHAAKHCERVLARLFAGVTAQMGVVT